MIRLQRAMFAAIDEGHRRLRREGIEADIVENGVMTLARNPAQAARLRRSVAHARSWGYDDEGIMIVDPAERWRVAGAIGAS